MIFKNITVILSLTALAGVGYVFVAPSVKLPDFSFAKETSSYPVLRLANSRDLHEVKVVRCDADGFVVSCFEGTFKLWNYQLTSDAFAKLRKGSPAPTPTPVYKSLLDSTPAPGKEKKSSFSQKSLIKD